MACASPPVRVHRHCPRSRARSRQRGWEPTASFPFPLLLLTTPLHFSPPCIPSTLQRAMEARQERSGRNSTGSLAPSRPALPRTTLPPRALPTPTPTPHPPPGPHSDPSHPNHQPPTHTHTPHQTLDSTPDLPPHLTPPRVCSLDKLLDSGFGGVCGSGICGDGICSSAACATSTPAVFCATSTSASVAGPGSPPPRMSAPIPALNFAMSLCGHIHPFLFDARDDWPPAAATPAELDVFDQHLVSQESFTADQSLLYHADLRIRVGESIYTWAQAAPLTVSWLAFGAPLDTKPQLQPAANPATDTRHRASSSEKRGSGEKRSRSQRRSFKNWFFGRDDSEAVAGQDLGTEPVAHADVDGIYIQRIEDMDIEAPEPLSTVVSAERVLSPPPLLDVTSGTHPRLVGEAGTSLHTLAHSHPIV